MGRPIPLAVAAACLGLVLGACRAPVMVSSPRATVEEARITDHSQAGTRVEVAVRLENPNDVPLALGASSYELAIEGPGRFEGTVAPKRTVAAGGTQRVVFAASFPEPAEAVSGKPFTFRATVPFEPPSKIRRVLTESAVPLPALAIRGEGRVGGP